MTVNSIPTDCRFCSVVSRTNGEDPIGSAWPYEQWLIIEMTQPWSQKLWLEHPTLHPILETIKALREQQGLWIRPLLIAPDRKYSYPGYIRVLHYHRPSRLFAQFEKQEFVLPDAEISSLATALLKQPDDLRQFERYWQETSQIRELMVCTHGNVDVACARFGYPIYEKLRSEYAIDEAQLRVWRCSHFGGHNFAPTLIDLPEGRYWGHLEPEILDLLVHRHSSVTGLRPFYRGWCGLGRFEQIAEREIWMREGWDWLNYHKAGQVLVIDPANEADDADWVEVRIDFTSPDGSDKGAYEARIEVSDRVTTMWNSGDEQSLKQVKQYRVSRLVKIA